MRTEQARARVDTFMAGKVNVRGGLRVPKEVGKQREVVTNIVVRHRVLLMVVGVLAVNHVRMD